MLISLIILNFLSLRSVNVITKNSMNSSDVKRNRWYLRETNELSDLIILRSTLLVRNGTQLDKINVKDCSWLFAYFSLVKTVVIRKSGCYWIVLLLTSINRSLLCCYWMEYIANWFWIASKVSKVGKKLITHYFSGRWGAIILLVIIIDNIISSMNAELFLGVPNQRQK